MNVLHTTACTHARTHNHTCTSTNTSVHSHPPRRVVGIASVAHVHVSIDIWVVAIETWVTMTVTAVSATVAAVRWGRAPPAPAIVQMQLLLM